MDANQGTYIIWGPPGCGKTTYLSEKTRDFVQWAAVYHPENRTPVLLCSLTRTAAAEIAGRGLPLPGECISTLHGHAFRALGLNRDCVAEAHISEFNELHPAYRLSGGKGDSENPEWDRTAGTPGDELAEEYQLLRARMVDRKLWPSRVSAFASRWESWKDESGAVDYTDMIERAYREVDFPPGRPKILIADEAQDLSALEYALLKRWGQAAGRLIITGDPYQALYVWRGAHPEVFLDPAVPADRRRVLSQSYRVPRAVHRMAMRWISQLSNYQPLEYHPRDEEGRITTSPATCKCPERAVDLAERYLADGRSVMFASSCSFLLGPLTAVLRKRGLPFSNPWRRSRGDWNPLGELESERRVSMARRIVEFLRPDVPSFGESARYWTPQELKRWAEVLKASGLMVHGGKAAIELAAADEQTSGEPIDPDDLDYVFEPEPLAELVRLLGEREELREGVELQHLLAWWSSRLLPKRAKAAAFALAVAKRRGVEALGREPRLFIGTVHSFKGAEADVVILFPDLSPSGFREWNRPGASRDSVVRMIYVALTRSRQDLVVCTPATSSTVNLRPFLN